MYALAYKITLLCPFDIDPAATTQQPITTTSPSTVASVLSTTSIAGALVGVLALIIAAVIIVIVIVFALKRQVYIFVYFGMM